MSKDKVYGTVHRWHCGKRGGISAYFEYEGQRYKADISDMVDPIETMIFPCDEDWNEDSGQVLFYEYHDELTVDNLMHDITAFLNEKRASA